jgi:hypothetical protein
LAIYFGWPVGRQEKKISINKYFSWPVGRQDFGLGQKKGIKISAGQLVAKKNNNNNNKNNNLSWPVGRQDLDLASVHFLP